RGNRGSGRGDRGEPAGRHLLRRPRPPGAAALAIVWSDGAWAVAAGILAAGRYLLRVHVEPTACGLGNSRHEHVVLGLEPRMCIGGRHDRLGYRLGRWRQYADLFTSRIERL